MSKRYIKALRQELRETLVDKNGIIYDYLVPTDTLIQYFIYPNPTIPRRFTRKERKEFRVAFLDELRKEIKRRSPMAGFFVDEIMRLEHQC